MAETVELALGYREPFDGESLLGFLRARAVAGVEVVAGGSYRRTLPLRQGGGHVALTPQSGTVRCELRLDDPRDLPVAEASFRRLFDLDADPVAISTHLGADPVLGPLVGRRPGLRVPGSVDGFELGVRAIVGQQISVGRARDVLGRLVEELGEPVGPEHRSETGGGLTHRFPDATALAAADPAGFPFPRVRARALVELGRLVACGELALEPGGDPAEVRERLLAVPGIGPWTAGYVTMRALGDPDVFLPGDVGIRNALARLEGAPDVDAWRPWRSYAVMHLWRGLGE